MAGKEETRDPQWGNWLAKVTFVGTVILAGLFVGVVILFIIL